MRRLALIVLASLAGCGTAPSPSRVIEGGQRHEFSSSRASKVLADCTAVNARSFSSRYTSSVGEMIRPDNFQVVVSELRTLDYDPIIVARTAPAAGGSQLVVFTDGAMGEPRTSDWIERLRKGC
jgi:hypothetical protein